MKGHGQGQKVKFKVNFKKWSEWPEHSSESFRYVNMQILPLTELLKVTPKKGEHSL